MNPDQCLICVDAGTTNTRVWLTRGVNILARAHAGVGVRDTARHGSPAKLHETLRDLIVEVAREAESPPVAVVAAGMITSSLGLVEVPHIPAPAGVNELASSLHFHSNPEITDLPIILVPGVRSGEMPCNPDTVGRADLMRGEETLCAGLIESGMVRLPGAVLNLGSHWKAILLDGDGRISSSVTSLSGEMIHAAQTQTILASAVPGERPENLDLQWLESGMREARDSGIARALFGVRLLEQSQSGSPEQRFSFLAGAFIATEIDSLVKKSRLQPSQPVVITGGGALGNGWQFALEQLSISVKSLTGVQTESALLKGFNRIVILAMTSRH